MTPTSPDIRHELTAKDEAVVSSIRAQSAPFKGMLSGPEARGGYDAMIAAIPDAGDVIYDTSEVGGVSGVWCRPKHARPDAAILYLHGGAYVLGSAQAYAHFAGQFAARTNTSAFIPDYGLAPERPFPAGVNDAQAAYRGLVAQGIAKVVIVGDSAGGGLSLVLLGLAQADANAGKGVAPTACVVMSPWTDLALTGSSYATRADEEPYLTGGTTICSTPPSMSPAASCGRTCTCCSGSRSFRSPSASRASQRGRAAVFCPTAKSSSRTGFPNRSQQPIEQPGEQFSKLTNATNERNKHMNAPDLTQRPPRSPHVRLGGYAILPRILDKARAALAGRLGDYKFNNPLDNVLFGFAGLTAEAFLAQAKTGAGDFEMLQWFNAQAKKAPHEIAAWSAWTETFVENDVETREWLAGRIKTMDARRADIASLFDYLDLDDYLSFGGQP